MKLCWLDVYPDDWFMLPLDAKSVGWLRLHMSRALTNCVDSTSDQEVCRRLRLNLA